MKIRLLFHPIRMLSLVAALAGGLILVGAQGALAGANRVRSFLN